MNAQMNSLVTEASTAISRVADHPVGSASDKLLALQSLARQIKAREKALRVELEIRGLVANGGAQ